jgi:hypothetical protein
MQEIKKTIAIQVTDQEFLDKYEKRIGETGMKVKDYLMGLITADIENAELAKMPEPEPGQETGSGPDQNTTPVQSSGITNMFIKVTKDQREAIDARKLETGENVGTLINRLIGEFLENVGSGDFPEGFDETYDYYASVAGTCDTTCSAKIPAESNQELSAYLEQTGKSRNVLMSCLVHMDLHGQEMSEDQHQGMTM